MRGREEATKLSIEKIEKGKKLVNNIAIDRSDQKSAGKIVLKPMDQLLQNFTNKVTLYK